MHQNHSAAPAVTKGRHHTDRGRERRQAGDPSCPPHQLQTSP